MVKINGGQDKSGWVWGCVSYTLMNLHKTKTNKTKKQFYVNWGTENFTYPYLFHSELKSEVV